MTTATKKPKQGTVLFEAKPEVVTGKLVNIEPYTSVNGKHNFWLIFDTGERITMPENWIPPFTLYVGQAVTASWSEGKFTIVEL